MSDFFEKWQCDTSSSQCACVTCARFESYVTISSSSAKGKRERASCPRICASSSVVRPREREATETAEEREASYIDGSIISMLLYTTLLHGEQIPHGALLLQHFPCSPHPSSCTETCDARRMIAR